MIKYVVTIYSILLLNLKMIADIPKSPYFKGRVDQRFPTVALIRLLDVGLDQSCVYKFTVLLYTVLLNFNSITIITPIFIYLGLNYEI